jgi:hypothetical protein
MTAEEARGRVTKARRALDRAMRALSVPGPDWGAAVDALLDASREANELALRCLDEKARRMIAK